MLNMRKKAQDGPPTRWTLDVSINVVEPTAAEQRQVTEAFDEVTHLFEGRFGVDQWIQNAAHGWQGREFFFPDEDTLLQGFAWAKAFMRDGPHRGYVEADHDLAGADFETLARWPSEKSEDVYEPLIEEE